MERGLHGVKVDVWGVGYLVRSCGLTGLPKMLRELQNRCLDQTRSRGRPQPIVTTTCCSCSPLCSQPQLVGR
ncbi:uncharacterized protein Pyn_07566 [Prunus yedoensis var. nudiflora]|uniref:Uncharacterized protein n=1 Tax=Prunus yedoensis var. nudiflora TaxID=2094558 RepID=A0A314UHL8_PRUYE|nr:uncharacterized protein Pyn_07566 [Prunus yedoensis var. nudiflora]